MNRNKQSFLIDDDSLEIERLMHNPALTDNPLLPVVERMYQQIRQQHQQLERLLKIADGFDSLVHNENINLLERYQRQIKRLEKIVKISDLYQKEIIRLNEQLIHASLHDPLTDLPNRRYLVSRLQEQTALANRHKRPYSLLLVDLDHFKYYNDRYGHEFGDHLLCKVAEVFNECLRSFDVCGRWGGEEFLILLPDATLPTTEEVGWRLLEKVKTQISIESKNTDTESPLSNVPQNVTFSAGITTYRLDEDYHETLRRADNAMYQAKTQGRAQIVTAG